MALSPVRQRHFHPPRSQAYLRDGCVIAVRTPYTSYVFLPCDIRPVESPMWATQSSFSQMYEVIERGYGGE